MLDARDALLLVVDFQERLMPSIHRREEITGKAAALIEGCRVLDLPILVTQQYTKGLGPTIREIDDALVEYEYIEKITFSCCGSGEFRGKLGKAGRKSVIITGIETHVCIQQTVLDLLEGGYQVYAIADCLGSRSDSDFRYAIRRMEKAGAIVTTMESILFEMLVSADHPKRKEITVLVK